MSLAAPLASPFYEGSGTSDEVPGVWDAALNGRPYMLDTALMRSRDFARLSIALLKPQQDTRGVFSERSLNPEDFPRFAQESWHKGAGQVYADREESDAARFRSSKGVDVWTRWEMSLLPDTTLKLASANTNLLGLPVGSNWYVLDGTALRRTTDLTTFVAITGMPAAAGTSIASDGFNVWTAHVANGLYHTTRGAAGATQLVTSALASNSVVGYVKGRLMVSKDNAIYNVTSTVPAALPAALLTHPNTDFVWVGFAEGPGHLYAAGFSGDKSLIFKTAVKPEGTGLDAPTVAGELPDGEIVRTIRNAIGGESAFLAIGTDSGWRLATINDDGNLDIGARTATTSPVRDFEPQDRFLWYGLTNYDATSTGLGRADLTIFNETAPAYASDLMATTQGAVLSISTFTNLRVFTISGVGVYAESVNRVATGTLDSGLITFGMPDPKIAMSLDVRHRALEGSHSPFLSTDEGTFENIGSHTEGSTSTGATYLAGESRGEVFEVRESLARSATDLTAGPVLTRHTLEVNPAPGRGEFLVRPFFLREKVDTHSGSRHMDPAAEYAALLDIQAAGRPVLYQDGAESMTVFLDDHVFMEESYTKDRSGWNGTFIAKLRRPRRRV